jgi:hypothetical protein
MQGSFPKVKLSQRDEEETSLRGMRVQTLHQVYLKELETFYGTNRPSPAPAATRPEKSHSVNFVDIEQEAQQLDRIFEWLGQPPMLPQMGRQEQRR